VQVLSSPRVATLNNQKAIIKVGTDEFFVTDITSTATTSAVGTNFFPTIELTPFFSGIALDVTPQISEDNRVTLHIHPSVSEVVDQQKTVTIGTLTQQIPLALSTVRESDSIVRANSGQVVVIGGLMQDSINDENAATPGLSDIPVLGNAFKHKRRQSAKRELVILLRPVVVDDDEVWTREMDRSRDALKSMRQNLGRTP
jgi:MSHA biogenesis protein MshL